MARTPDPFTSALHTLRSAHQERRSRRLTPTVPAPRDSDPTVGYPEPEHRGPGDDDSEARAAVLPPPRSAWASSDADSDDGGGPR